MKPIERSVILPAPPERVWAALTDPRQLSSWFGAEVQIEPRPRGRATFRWPDGRERSAVVEEVERGRRLAFRWLPFERTPEGQTSLLPPGRVVFVLEDSGAGTILTVTEGSPASRLLAAGRVPETHRP